MTIQWGTMYAVVDEYGNQVERTKDKYPYSYDGFVTHRLGKNEEANSTVYSDRLWQWDYGKYEACVKKVFGDHRQMFYDATPDQIERLLRLYYNDDSIRVILIMEYCNVSNGYPVWRFDFNIKK